MATVFTLLAIVGGTGGALAIASSGGSGQVHSAAVSQYVPHPPGPCTLNGHHYRHCPQRKPHHFRCHYRGHDYKHCPYAKGVKGVYPRYPHHFHCRYKGKYYKQCPYSSRLKGVHRVHHK